MLLQKLIRNIPSLLILAFIGSIFILKYFSRYINFAEIIAFAYFSIFVAIFIVLQKKALNKLEYLNKNIFAIFFIIIVLVSIITISYFPEKSRVARLPAITSWIDYLLKGEFPWNSPAEPSGFPLLFILAIPFYFLGNLGYLEVLGLIVFGLILYRYPSSTNKDIWIRLFTLLCLPTFYYEFLVRSELFFNMSLVIAVILFMGENISPQRLNIRFFLTALLFGLIFSTRSIVAVVYAIYITFLFRDNLLNGIIFSSMAVVAFTMTLLPFIIWDSRSFFDHGPFSIQLSHLPLWATIIFFFLSVASGWKVRDIHEVVLFSGLIIFAIVATKFILTIANEGFYGAIFGDRFDISYFILCVPFLVLSMRNISKTTKLFEVRIR